MDLEHRVAEQFAANIEQTSAAASALPHAISLAATSVVESLLQGGKILCCGNGGSDAAAQHFAAKMINRFERQRPGLPAITLSTASSIMTSVASDHSYEHIFSKQVSTLGHPGDIMLVISSTGNSANLCQAVTAAEDRQMKVIALTGGDGGQIADMLQEQDTEIRVPASGTSRTQEIHLLVIHCLCDLIDVQLLGS